MLDYRRKLSSQSFSIFDANSLSAPLHKHTYLELGYVRSGSMEHLVNESRYILQTGDYFIIDHSMSHSYRSVERKPLLVRNVIFAPSFLDKGLTGSFRFRDLMSSYLLRFCYQTLHSDPTGITFHDEDGKIGEIIDTIIKEYKEETYGHLEYIRSLLTGALILTMRKIGASNKQAGKSAVVNQMIKHADNHYRENIRLNALAKQLGYSAPYLSQKFSSEMGICYMDYIHELRIRRACHLLETTNIKIAQIAEEIGYDGTQYFNQIFKKHLSVTPAAFRAMYK